MSLGETSDACLGGAVRIALNTTNTYETIREVLGQKNTGTFAGMEKYEARKYGGAEDVAGPGKHRTSNAGWVLSCRARPHEWGTEDSLGWAPMGSNGLRHMAKIAKLWRARDSLT